MITAKPLTTNPESPGTVTGLAAFFAVLYFVQGLGDPTSGLIAQPVRSLLQSWGESPTSVAGLMALLALPWTFKPLFGLLSDYVPFFGYRRRSYLLAASASAVLGLLILWLVPLPAGSVGLLMFCLMLPTVGIIFSDVLADAMMIERGQPLGLTGLLQSVQWTAGNIALLLTGVTAGYLAAHGLQQTAFLICAVLWGISLLLAWFYAREPEVQAAPLGFSALRDALSVPGLLPLIGILFLWSMNPLWVSVLYFHINDGLGFGEQVYGNTYSFFSLGAVIASSAYAVYCRRIRLGILLNISIVTGIFSNAVYWQMSTTTEAYIISLVAGWAYMTGVLIQLDLAARLVPVALAATLFALIMAATNFSAAISEALGGFLYGWLQPAYTEETAFRVVVMLSMLLAASCWLLVPSLQRSRPEWWDGSSNVSKKTG